MAFKVWLGGEDDPAECGDADTFEFQPGGALAVHYASPGRWSDFYPAGVWVRVSAQPNHRPGEPANRSIGPDFDN